MELVRVAVKTIGPLLPPETWTEIEPQLPLIVASAAGLGIEVMRAELMGTPYSQAVRQPTFPLMSRMHFGVEDVLHQVIDPEFRISIDRMIACVMDGEFDPLRRDCFIRASRRNDPEGALLRFLFYQAARFNLLIATWYRPIVEAAGTFRRTDDRAQDILEEFLALPLGEVHDVRPFEFFVSEVIAVAFADVDIVEKMSRQSRGEFAYLKAMETAVAFVRSLSDADAAAMRLSSLEDEMGSQQVADRYPQHFRSANAVDKRRSRLAARQKNGLPPTTLDGGRLIDMLLKAMEESDL